MESKESKKSNKKLFIIVGAIAAVIVAVVITIVLIIVNGRPKLFGKWNAEGSSWYYDFTSDTEGLYGYHYDSIDYPAQKFTYVDNGDHLTITYEGFTTGMDLNYRLEGNKLIVTDSFGTDVTYIHE